MKKKENRTYNIGLSTKNGLFFTKNNQWKTFMAFKTVQAIEKINPFAFFCFKNEPLILFFHNPSNLSTIHQLCWNFNKAPVIIILYSEEQPISDEGNELRISIDDKIEIFNGFNLNEKSGRLHPLDIELSEFNYWNIVSGRVWEQHTQSFKNENKVDYKLLNNVDAVRTKLIENINNKKQAAAIVNRVLGRLIFVRYLIDREVKINFKQKDYLSKDDLTNIISNESELYDLFIHLQDIFNGDLFPFVGESKEEIKNGQFERKHLSQVNLALISNLFKGDDIVSGQRSLFHIYDFSIIPIELVSNIYEYFMGDKKQAKNKAFYTPPFLVDYLINETIEPHLANEDTWHCTTLDPACGSGIFLVEALRRIILKYKTLNPRIVEHDIKQFKYDIVNLLKDNIYGIDKDRDAIDVAIFSLYITLLDFIESPKNVEGFRFPYLLRSNFFEADFFETDFSENKENDFVEKLKRVKLDFIIGNPPWGRVKKEESPFLDYAAKRLKNEPEELKRLQQLFSANYKGQKRNIKLVENNEIAQAFLLRTSDFADKDETQCALLVTSKVLHNGQSDVFRNYLLNNTKVEKVIDFSAIRKHIFSKPKGAKDTVGPCAFLIYKWSDKNKEQIVQHYSPKLNNVYRVFRILTIQKYDYKKIPQEYFLDFDWAWKVFLYGNFLDFRFIKFLKENYQPISNLLSDSKRFLCKQGIILNGKDKNDASHLKGLKVIAMKDDLTRFFVSASESDNWNYNSNSIKSNWKRDFAHRPKKHLFEQGLFDGNSLLIKKGISTDFLAISAYCSFPVLFRDYVTAIKAYNLSDSVLLKSLSGLLNSYFFSFYILSVGSSTGIEREQVHNYEKFSLPIVENTEIARLVDTISSLKAQIHQLKKRLNIALLGEKINIEIEIANIEQQGTKLEEQIEYEIHESFNFSKEEKALIDYSQQVSIPLFKGENTPFQQVEKLQLKKYTSIFRHFLEQVFGKSNKYFQIEVLRSTFVIGVKFKILSKKPSKVFNYKEDKEQKQILNMLSVIAFEQITDKVFVQKDVKVINKDSFWIIKPNEFKCWHEAVAYLDLEEFIPRLISLQTTQSRAV